MPESRDQSREVVVKIAIILRTGYGIVKTVPVFYGYGTIKTVLLF